MPIAKGLAYKESSIGRVLVSKSYRGKDLAKQLMEKGINFILNNMREREIKIQAQAYLFKFYSSFGFTPISEEYLEDNIPHIDMIYRIWYYYLKWIVLLKFIFIKFSSNYSSTYKK